MNQRVTKRIKEIFLMNRPMPFKEVPAELKNTWRKVKKQYNATPRPHRHAALWEKTNG